MSGQRASKETKIIVLLIILSMVIWCAVFGLNKSKTEKAEETLAQLELIRSVGIPDRIVFEDTDSVITLVREGTDWKCVEGDFYIDTTATTYMFSVIKHFEPEISNEIPDGGLEGAGLFPPERRVVFTNKNGETNTFYVGKYNPIVGLFYFTMEGDDHFYMIKPEEAVFFLLKEEHLRGS